MKYQIRVRHYPNDPGKVKITVDSETVAMRLKSEWEDRLIDDGYSNAEELVYIRRIR